MARRVVVVLSAVIVVATPTVLTGNAVWLLMQPWFVDAQYALPGFPVDPDGVQEPDRTALAKTGVRAVRPGGEGVALLERARLPDRRPAFEQRELRHMRDVRALVSALLVAWIAALACAVAAAIALRRLGARAAARRSLRHGGLLAVGLMAGLGVAMLIGFDQLFTALHSLTFEGRSWRFDDRDTIRQLFPDAFWVVAGAALTGLVLAQAGAILALLRRRRPAAAVEAVPSACD